jgi:hypothetical protein
MDPPSPIRRDLTQEEILEDIINDADPTESPSRFLNPSGEGEEVDRREEEATVSDDGGADSSDDGEADGTLTTTGEVYI